MVHLLCLALCWTQAYTVGQVYEPQSHQGPLPSISLRAGMDACEELGTRTQEEHCWETMPPVKPQGSGLALELSSLWVLIYHRCALSSCILGSWGRRKL